MADKRISELTESFAIGTDDYVPINRTNSTLRLNLKNRITGAFTDEYHNIRLGANTISTGVGAGGGASNLSAIAIGNYALAVVSGSNNNIGIGQQALGALKVSNNNIGIGYYAGTGVVNMYTSVLLGSYSHPGDSSVSNCIAIGYQTTGGGSNTVTIGNNNITYTYLKGDVSFSGWTLAERAAPSTPSAGYISVYGQTDGRLYYKDDTGTQLAIAGLTGSGPVQGDIIYASGNNSYGALPKNTTATRYISNTGTNNNPAWAQINLTNGVDGILPLANGGTNAITATGAMVNLAGAAGLNYVYEYDDFLGTSSTSAQIGSFGWGGAGTVSFRGYELNHPGIFRVTSTSPTIASLYTTYVAGQGMASFSGLTIEGVFRIDSITNSVASFGLGYVNSPVTTNGARVLYFDTGVSANWQLLHRTQAGVATYVNTTKAAVANDWVKAKLLFSGGTTYCSISTTSSPTETTVYNTGADTHSTLAHCPQFLITSSNSTKSIDVDAFALHGVVSRL